MDQIKTQVLFLHAEPSAMEPAASRLPDNFSVHMASSGTEALTTLGLTPIHIIVSAEDLPGMSGREALAEANKRSPDTKGILLASPRMTTADRAALVNAHHLHQILNAGATPDQICDAVLTLAGEKDEDGLPQPANDRSAGPAVRTTDPARRTGQFATVPGLSPEHIPTLQPGSSPFQPAMDSISKVEVLVLTNDSSFLNTIRGAVGTSHVVNHAPNLQEAVDVVKLGRSGILVTDAAVATKDVEIITSKLRKFLPSLVTVVAGRREDGEKMMGLISDGLVYRFLLKPISAGRSRLAIEASAKKHLALANTDVPLSPEEVQKKMTETGVFKADSFQSSMFRTTDIRETRVTPDPFGEEDELSAPSRAAGLVRRIPPRYLLGTGAAIAVIAILAIVWPEGGDDEADAAAQAAVPAAAPATPAAGAQPETTPPSPAQSESSRLVAAAERAMQQNRIIDPPGDNAVEYYAGALAANPQSRSIGRALNTAVERSLSVVENALLRGNTDAAAQHLAILSRVAPDHPRLPFLTRQTEQKTQQALVDRARELIAGGDLAGAAATLDEAAAKPGADEIAIADLRTQIDAAGANLLTTSALLDLATDRVSRGQLVEPASDSARDYYQAVLARDPENATATQGLAFLSGLLLGNSRNALASGDIDSAYRWLSEAEATGAAPDVVAELRSRIAAAQSEASGEDSAATAPPAVDETSSRPAVAAVEQATTGADSATPRESVPAADAGVTAQPDTAPLAGAPQAETRAEAAASETAAVDLEPVADAGESGTIDGAVTDDATAGSRGADTAVAALGGSASGSDATVDEATSDSPGATAGKPLVGEAPDEGVAARKAEPELEQVRYVPPRYPRSAQRRELEGWVDVQFLVQANGQTTDVSVLNSAPADVFDRAAIDAVESWRYAPLSQTDSSVSRRARVRLEFTLQE